jgi:hypothetical protein
MSSTSRRTRKLIQPRLQLKLVLSFLGLTVLALTLQSLLLGALLAHLAAELPQDGTHLLQALPSLLTSTILLSLSVCLPLTFCVGVILTFRVAGPLYRMEQYLRQLARGETSSPCRIRREDELQEFCAVLNEATAPLLQQRTTPHALDPRPRDEAA